MLHSIDLLQRKAEAAGGKDEPGATLSETNLSNRLSDIVWPLGVSLGILLLWEALCRGFGIRPILLPPPSAILTAMASRGVASPSLCTLARASRGFGRRTDAGKSAYEHAWQIIGRDYSTGSFVPRLPQFRSSCPDPVGDHYRSARIMGQIEILSRKPHKTSR